MCALRQISYAKVKQHRRQHQQSQRQGWLNLHPRLQNHGDQYHCPEQQQQQQQQRIGIRLY